MAAASVEGSKRKITYPNRNWASSDKNKYEPSKLGPSKSAIPIPPVSSRILKTQPSLRPLLPSFKSGLVQSKSSAKPSVKNPENEEDTSLELFEKELVDSFESNEGGHENCESRQPSSLKSRPSQSKSSAGATVQNHENEEDICLELFEKELVESFEIKEQDPKDGESMQPSSLKSGLPQSKSSGGVSVKNLEDEENISLQIFEKELNDFLESEEQDKYCKSVPSSKTKSFQDSVRLQTPLVNPDLHEKKICSDGSSNESRSAGNSKSGSSESNSDSSSQSETSSGSHCDATSADKAVSSRPAEECEGDIDVEIDMIGEDPALNLVDCPSKKVDQDAKKVNLVQDKESSVSPSLHEQADKKKPQFVSNINGSSRKVLNRVDERANNSGGSTDEAIFKRKRGSDTILDLPMNKKRSLTKNCDPQSNFSGMNLGKFLDPDLSGEKRYPKEQDVASSLNKSAERSENASKKLINIGKEKAPVQVSRPNKATTISNQVVQVSWPNKATTISNQVGIKRKCSADGSEDCKDPKMRRFQSGTLAKIDVKKTDDAGTSRKESEQNQSTTFEKKSVNDQPRSYLKNSSTDSGKLWDPWSEIDYSSYRAYDKDEPHVKKSIEDYSQYQEYVREYRQMYGHYCSLQKMLEKIRNYFLEIGRQLDAAKVNDGNKYHSILLQLRQLHHKNEANHKKLLAIFRVLHEEIKDIKLRITEYVEKNSQD